MFCCSKYIVLLFLVCSFLGMCSVGCAQNIVPSGPVVSDDAVRTPGNDPPYSLGLDLLWLRPTSTKLLYAVLDPRRSNSRVLGKLEGLAHKRDFALRLTCASRMSRNGSGLEAAYEHFNSSQEAAAARGTSSSIWGLLLHPNSTIDDDNVTNLIATTSFNLNEGNFGSRVSFRFDSGGNLTLSGGIQYTRLRQEFTIKYIQQLSATSSNQVIVNRRNTLSGFGPRFALGTSWDVRGVNLYGQIAAAMLVGDVGGQVNQTDYPYGSSSVRRVDVDLPYGTRIVPAVGMKLGVRYDRQSDWGLFGIDFGYEVRNYFNAVSTYEFYDDVDSQIGANDQSDIGIDGFFLGLRGALAFSGP